MFNKIRFMVLGSIMLWSLQVMSEDPPLIIINAFKSDKVLYDFNEQVNFTAEIANMSDLKDFRLEVVIRKGVDEKFLLAPINVEIMPKNKRKITFVWNSGKSEYGHAAFLIIRNDTGKPATISKPVIFEVCHDWRKIIRQGSFPVYHHNFDPDSPKSSNQSLTNKVKLFRKWGYNSVEFFGPYQSQIDNLNPKENIWKFLYKDVPKKRRRIVAISKKKLKKRISGFHKAGIKVINYIHTPNYAIHDESWRLYDPISKKEIHYSNDSVEMLDWLKSKNMGFPNSLLFCKEYGNKIVESVREYDWDGCFFDDFNTITKEISRM